MMPVALRFLVRRLQPARAQHRHDGHGDEQRHRQREHHDERQLREQDAGGAGQEQQRHEHGDVRQRRRQNRRPDFLAAVDGGGHLVLAHVQVAVRVLEHDDRGVDDHADAERQTAEGHRVQREAAEVEQRERADDRDRDRRADDQRRAEVAQEREDDQHDQDAADDGVLLHVVDGALDERSTLSCVTIMLDARHLAVDARRLRRGRRRPPPPCSCPTASAPACCTPGLPLMRMNGRRCSVRVLDVGDVAHVDRHAVAGHARPGCGCPRCSGTGPGCARRNVESPW